MAVGSKNARQFRDLFGECIPFKATVDVASLADGAGATNAITVTGASLGDFVLLSGSLDSQDITVTAYVSAANTVEVRHQNESGGVIDLASQTIKGVVLKEGGAFSGL